MGEVQKMKIKIGPIDYTIEKKTVAQFKKLQGLDDYIGLADHRNQKILVLDGMAPDLTTLVLTHEIIHAVASVYGIDNLQENEASVHSMAVAIVELMKNNPWWVRRIMVKK